MARYRKRPVVIEAWPVKDILHAVAKDWSALPPAVAEEYERGGFVFASTFIVIGTLEGQMTADFGDWLIKGVEGEFYPCKPEIFAKTYELAEEPADVHENQLCLHMNTSTEYVAEKTTCLDCGKEAPL